MDNLMVFDEKEKRKLAIMAYMPGVLFLITLIVYIIMMVPAMQRHDINYLAVAITRANYSVLFAMLAVSAIVSACVLIYFLVILARIRNLNATTKVLWVVILAALVPLSFLLFYNFVIKKEPRYVGIFPDIA